MRCARRGLDALRSTADCAAFSTLHVTCHVMSGCAAVGNLWGGAKSGPHLVLMDSLSSAAEAYSSGGGSKVNPTPSP